jgi:hypothetical protein
MRAPRKADVGKLDNKDHIMSTRHKITDNNDLNELVWSFRASRLLQVVTKLDLFTQLAENPLPLEEIVRLCSTKPDLMEKVLIACLALGLLDRRGGLYHNTAFSDTYMVRGRDLYQGDIIAHSASTWEFWNTLEDELRCEKAPPLSPEQQHRNFILGMRNIARAGRLQVILDKIDLSSRRQLFDLGGGPGAYSIAFCKKFPQLKAILFDLPETIAIAKEVITEAGMQELIALQSGSWDADEFGSDTDVFLSSTVMHGPSNQADMKLAKAYRSMTSGALLLIQEFLLNDDKTGPLIPALFNIMVGAFSRSELFAVIEQAGFVNPRIIAESEDCSATWIAAEKP